LDPHATQPWVATADEKDRIIIWDYERQETLRSFALQNLTQSSPGSSDSGALRAVRWYDADTLWWSCRRTATDSSLGVRKYLLVLCELELIMVDALALESTHISCDALKLKGTLCCVEVLSASIIAIGCNDGAVRLWDWCKGTLERTLRYHKEKTAVTHLVNAHPDSTWEPVQDGDSGNSSSSNNSSSKRIRLISRGDDGQILFWDMPLDADFPPLVLDKKKDEKDCASLLYCAATDTVSALVARRRAGQAGEMRLLCWDLDRATDQTVPLVYRNKMSRSKGGVSHAALDFPGLPHGAVAACGKDSRIHFMARSSSSSGAAAAESSSNSAFGAQDSSEAAAGGADDQTVTPLHIASTTDVSSLVAGLPEKLKFYLLQAHPLQRHVLFCGSNTGLFVLRFKPHTEPTHVCHPSWGPSAMLSVQHSELRRYVVSWGEGLAGHSTLREEAAMYVLPSSPDVQALQRVASDSTISTTGGGGGRGSSIDDAVAVGDKLLVDPSGTHVAVLSRSKRSYRVFTISDVDMQEIERGEGVLDFAWFGTAGMFAVLLERHRSSPATTHTSAKAAAAAAAAASAASPRVPAAKETGSTIAVKQINGIAVDSTGSYTAPDSEALVRLHGGGPVLCVTHSNSTAAQSGSTAQGALAGSSSMTSSAPMVASAQQSTTVAVTRPGAGLGFKPVQAAAPQYCRCFAWRAESATLVAVSDVLPAPVAVAWDDSDSVHRCALAHGTQVQLYTLADSDTAGSSTSSSSSSAMHCTASCAVGREAVDSMVWTCGVLFYSTPSAVWAAFCPAATSSDATVTLMQLAHHSALSPPPTAWSRGGIRAAPLCRPVGFLHVLGLFKGSLLVRSTTGCYSVRLDQPCLRFAMLVCAAAGVTGEHEPAATVTAAVEWAQRKMTRDSHDSAAAFLRQHGYAQAAVELLNSVSSVASQDISSSIVQQQQSRDSCRSSGGQQTDASAGDSADAHSDVRNALRALSVSGQQQQHVAKSELLDILSHMRPELAVS
jgi:WD40 repeat protein